MGSTTSSNPAGSGRVSAAARSTCPKGQTVRPTKRRACVTGRRAHQGTKNIGEAPALPGRRGSALVPQMNGSALVAAIGGGEAVCVKPGTTGGCCACRPLEG